MEVQVISPLPAGDFPFDSTSTSPYATAPSSPQSTIPFTWEQKPGIPKQNYNDNYEEDDADFAFGHLERHSISAADELFDCGKIKPLKPPPGLHFSNDSPRSPKSPKLRFREALSPRSKKQEFDPFSEALKQTVGDQTETDQTQSQRGRERTTKTTRHKQSRSLSPFRGCDAVNNLKSSTDRSSTTGLTWDSKWKFKNLLLFRSASEGSVATRKDPLKKYTVLKKLSFRSTGNGGPETELPAEVNYTAERAVPYKSGLLGCLRFHQNGGSVHEISRGISSVIKQRE